MLRGVLSDFSQFREKARGAIYDSTHIATSEKDSLVNKMDAVYYAIADAVARSAGKIPPTARQKKIQKRIQTQLFPQNNETEVMIDGRKNGQKEKRRSKRSQLEKDVGTYSGQTRILDRLI